LRASNKNQSGWNKNFAEGAMKKSHLLGAVCVLLSVLIPKLAEPATLLVSAQADGIIYSVNELGSVSIFAEVFRSERNAISGNSTC